MNDLIQQLKDNDQDFEFYPTTQEIIQTVYNDIKSENYDYGRSFSVSLLDIGAGNGNIFNILENIISLNKDNEKEAYFTKYAIEKSKILINNMSKDIFIIGTDFYQQTLIDKNVDIIFCNPPYKEYVQWTKKIIREANSKYIYLVIPSRWKENKEILETIKLRIGEEKSYKILGTFDFLNAERQARCTVDIIKINLIIDKYDRQSNTDAFDIWFNENFKINADKEEVSKYDREQTQKEKLHSLVIGQNLIENMEELYNNDLKKCYETYKQIEKLDADILKELEINIPAVKEGLKLKIKGLKNLYWEELFEKLNVITDKLTSQSRKNMLEKLREHTNIDFSANNAYAIVIWAIKNANMYFDKQLCEIYKELTESKNVINYKSNKRMIEDDWRYCRRENHTHYILDYRIVVERWNCFNSSDYGRYEYPNGLHKNVNDFLNDICTVAKNLGFNILCSAFDYSWEPGKENHFYFYNGDNNELFMSVRPYKKGTVHIKFNQNFMKKFNIEASRLNQWVKSPREFSEETDIPFNEVVNYFGKNLQIGKLDVKLLRNG